MPAALGDRAECSEEGREPAGQLSVADTGDEAESAGLEDAGRPRAGLGAEGEEPAAVDGNAPAQPLQPLDSDEVTPDHRLGVIGRHPCTRKLTPAPRLRGMRGLRGHHRFPSCASRRPARRPRLCLPLAAGWAYKGRMGTPDKRKQSLYFPEDMLQEIQAEATRQDRSLSWIVQRAWSAARATIGKIPGTADRRPAAAMPTADKEG